MKLFTNTSKKFFCLSFVILMGILFSGPSLSLEFHRTIQWLGDDNTFDVSLADLDGDGDLDVFVANGHLDGGSGFQEGVANQVWLNTGDGDFIDSGQIIGNSISKGIGLCDIDGDGDLDAFVANSSTSDKVWLNDGNGLFTDSGQSFGDFSSANVAMADLDGDGDCDVFVVQFGPNKILLNDGNGGFNYTNNDLGSSASSNVSLSDLDGDGDIDAFVTNRRTDYTSPANKIWLNDGDGSFSDSGQSLGSLSSNAVAVKDVDGDGDVDAYVANSGANKLWVNNGNGVFADSNQSLGGSGSSSVILEDFDKDGDYDAFISSSGTSYGGGFENKLWLNDGQGGFTDSGQNIGKSDSTSASAGDVDGNGYLDIFIGNAGFSGRSTNRVWLNIEGSFSSNSQVVEISYTREVAVGDVDGDGDVDVFSANGAAYSQASTANQVLLNNGDATYIESGQFLGSLESAGVSLGDIDGDGDLDVFVGNVNTAYTDTNSNKIFINNGNGQFTDSGQLLGSSDTFAIALGDLDSDGDLDAFVGNSNGSYGSPNKVWLNDGTGVFVDSGQKLDRDNTSDIKLGDLDGDDDLDAVVSNTRFANRIWLNDGNGVFTYSNQYIGRGAVNATLKDLNGDGYLDAILSLSIYNNRLQVYLNDGSGNFAAGQLISLTYDSSAIEVGDLDGDYDVDIIIGLQGNRGIEIWLNDGGALFQKDEIILDSSDLVNLALIDLDGDSDLDIYTAVIGANIVWVNDFIKSENTSGGDTGGNTTGGGNTSTGGGSSGGGGALGFLCLTALLFIIGGIQRRRSMKSVLLRDVEAVGITVTG